MVCSQPRHLMHLLFVLSHQPCMACTEQLLTVHSELLQLRHLLFVLSDQCCMTCIEELLMVHSEALQQLHLRAGMALAWEAL